MYKKNQYLAIFCCILVISFRGYAADNLEGFDNESDAFVDLDYAPSDEADYYLTLFPDQGSVQFQDEATLSLLSAVQHNNLSEAEIALENGADPLTKKAPFTDSSTGKIFLKDMGQPPLLIRVFKKGRSMDEMARLFLRHLKLKNKEPKFKKSLTVLAFNNDLPQTALFLLDFHGQEVPKSFADPNFENINSCIDEINKLRLSKLMKSAESEEAQSEIRKNFPRILRKKAPKSQNESSILQPKVAKAPKIAKVEARSLPFID